MPPSTSTNMSTTIHTAPQGCRPNRAINLRSALIIAAALAALTTGHAHAQDKDYLELPLDPNCPTWYKLNLNQPPYQQFIEMLTGTQPLNAATFDAFFNDTVFPLMTQWKDRQIGGHAGSPLFDGPPKGGPAAIRAQFKTSFAVKGTNQAAHDELNRITLDKMQAIASDNYHPTVRLNSMLLIGDLTETADASSPPWKNALPALLKAAAANDTIDAVRVAALRGLLRHSQAGIDPSVRPQVIQGMLALVQQHTPPAGRSKEGHDWICRRAIDVLAAIGDAGNNGAVIKPLLATIDDQATSPAIRCAAAAALAKIKYAPPKEFDATAITKSLGKLAVDCTAYELSSASKSFGPIVIDRLKQDLNEILQGLGGADGKGGVAAWSSDAAYQKLCGLITTQIKGVITACDTPAGPSFSAPIAQMGIQQTSTPIPLDSQKPIATALKTASDNLQNAIDRGDAAPPAAAGAANP